jgi:TAT (twin-arginine translocation) pathway signal sequence
MAAQTSWASEVRQLSITDRGCNRGIHGGSCAAYMTGQHPNAYLRDGVYLMNRRRFLQLTGATGAAALTASCNRINSVACVRNHVGKQPASLAHTVSIGTSVFNGLAYRTGGGVCSRPILRHLQLPCLAVALPPPVVLRNAPRIRDKSAFDINEHF